jgi:hypothetical protein
MGIVQRGGGGVEEGTPGLRGRYHVWGSGAADGKAEDGRGDLMMIDRERQRRESARARERERERQTEREKFY